MMKKKKGATLVALEIFFRVVIKKLKLKNNNNNRT